MAMNTAKFYYDEVMSQELTTFSIYLYRSDDVNSRIDRLYDQGKQILRGVISQDASMGSQIIWNGSPLNLTSAWANLATNLKSASRNLSNAANNIKNSADSITSKTGKVMNWNQDAYYSINEFQKTFGGMTTSTPLTISAMILPYIDSKGVYMDVKTQLKTFLDCIYEKEEYTDKSKVNPSSSSGTSDNGSNWFSKLINGVANVVSNGLNWVGEQINTASQELLGNTENYIITLKPPHGYSGVPIDFIEGKWMANTLAIRIGKRQLYNLLISTITVTVSKEQVAYRNAIYPAHAQVELSFQPVLVIKPSEIKDYVLNDNLVGEDNKDKSSESTPKFEFKNLNQGLHIDL